MPGGRHQQGRTAARRHGGGATAIGAADRPHRSERWLHEARRGYTAVILALLVSLSVRLVLEADSAATAPPEIEFLLWFVAGYLILYVAITGLAFRMTPAHRYLPWAERSREGNWARHYLMGTHPGAGTAQAVSIFALILGVFWYPTAQSASVLTGWATAVLVASVVVSSWLAVAMTYSVAYLMADARSGYRDLEFPGDGPRRFTDYFYFSAGISTSFATSDVTVRSARMRRTVTGHSILAFGFNTVILAAVVSVLLR